MNHLKRMRLACILVPILATLVIRTAGAEAAQAVHCGKWNIMSSPNPYAHENELLGVAALSANDVWAVGSGYSAGIVQTLIEHWDGTSWSVVPSPNPASNGNWLDGAAALSASDIWAVGFTGQPHYPQQTLIEHWDGTSWSVVPSPSPGPGPLNGVAAVSTNDVWAVGYSFNGNTGQTLIEHWDGTSWSVVSSPNPGTQFNLLQGVAVVSSSDVWTVGEYDGYKTLIEHWDGTSWSVVPSPNNGRGVTNILTGVAAISATDIWAVGYYAYSDHGPFQTMIEHWNGKKWKVVFSPINLSGDNELLGVAALSTNDVWAVGYGWTNRDFVKALIEHWNGKKWSLVSSPRPHPVSRWNYLYGVAALSASDVWTVGYYGKGGKYQTLTEFFC